MAKRHENPQSAHRELTALLSSPEHHWTEAYRSKQDHNREQTMRLLVALDESLSPEQRQELHDRMIELAERLEAWAAAESSSYEARDRTLMHRSCECRGVHGRTRAACHDRSASRVKSVVFTRSLIRNVGCTGGPPSLGRIQSESECV